MNKIILIGEKSDNKIKNLIIKLLGDSYRLCIIDGSDIKICGRGERVTMIDLFATKELTIKNSLIVFKEYATFYPFLKIDESNLVILSSDNENQLHYAAKNKINAITCGLSDKDTITFSSKGNEKSVVSIQREIEYANTVIEPLETVVISSENDGYALLAVTAVKLILQHREDIQTSNEKV